MKDRAFLCYGERHHRTTELHSVRNARNNEWTRRETYRVPIVLVYWVHVTMGGRLAWMPVNAQDWDPRGFWTEAPCPYRDLARDFRDTNRINGPQKLSCKREDEFVLRNFKLLYDIRSAQFIARHIRAEWENRP